jgi:hypothetical protein
VSAVTISLHAILVALDWLRLRRRPRGAAARSRGAEPRRGAAARSRDRKRMARSPRGAGAALATGDTGCTFPRQAHHSAPIPEDLMRRTSAALALIFLGAACAGGDTATDTAAATTADAAATATPPAGGAAGDADRSVAGGGILVDGWRGKVDARAAGQGKTINDSRVAMNGNNIDLRVGPAAIYWNPANTASGNYEVKASFTENKHNPGHPHSYGVFIGGSNLDADDQALAYCIVYADGSYSVKYFHGADVETVVDREQHAAIRKADANGSATNEVGWRVRGDQASCVINGQAVKSWPKSQLVGADKLQSTDGVYGVRVSHNIDVTMTPLTMTRL